ncbi:MAG TPA: hypothetical protein VIF57_05630 [Polyangia bacterium]|jgi:hypothetical protein
MRVRLLAFGLLVAFAAQAHGQSVTTFNVTNNGFTAWRIAEAGAVDNPTLALVRGRTYNFNVNVSGHPFYIATSGSSAGAPQWTDGVTNNMVQGGTLTFVVPASAPSTLFYQCSFHNPMSGMLQISNPPSVPGLSPVFGVALGAVLLVLAVALLRRRRRA